jgi:16S rRNA (uracil1498-N3)-methyltransferase
VADGRGRAGEARLVALDAGRAVLEILAVEESGEPPARVVLLGVPRGPLLEEAVTLGTEAGASAFLLVRSRRSPPGEPRLDRLDRVARAAVTQCGRATMPTLTLGDLARALAEVPEGERWRCAPGGTPLVATAAAVTFAIGPEGGWEAEELARLDAAGFRPAGLGPHVLRTPTAVAVAMGRSWR